MAREALRNDDLKLSYRRPKCDLLEPPLPFEDRDEIDGRVATSRSAMAGSGARISCTSATMASKGPAVWACGSASGLPALLTVELEEAELEEPDDERPRCPTGLLSRASASLRRFALPARPQLGGIRCEEL